MTNLINRGLNFSILPKKLDFTQVQVDFQRFKRSAIWTEFWHGRDQEEEVSMPIFKTEKNNLPKNYSTPKELRVFLDSIESELHDPRNRNEDICNLPVEELNALKEIITLQRERKIVVKACDKGAGVIILNFEDYLKACYEHLTSKTANGISYYKQVDELEIERAKTRIKNALEEGLEREILTKHEFECMQADEKNWTILL